MQTLKNSNECDNIIALVTVFFGRKHMSYDLMRICEKAKFSTERFENFKAGLEAYPDIKEELDFYFDKKDFLCKVKVEGLSIVDVMVWQIDHFRAYLDRDTSLTRNDPETMVLLAIETLIELRKKPENILKSFESETGTDIIK